MNDKSSIKNILSTSLDKSDTKSLIDAADFLRGSIKLRALKEGTNISFTLEDADGINGTDDKVLIISSTGGGSSITNEISNGTTTLTIPSEDGDVYLTTNNDYQWSFNTDGSLRLPGNIHYSNQVINRVTNNIYCPVNEETIIYTSSNGYKHTIKVLIQVEGQVSEEGGWDTQSCEIMISKSFLNSNVAYSVYGITHTSELPMATFAAVWNSEIGRVQITCSPSENINNGVYAIIFITEITTSD